jgi:putative transposase
MEREPYPTDLSDAQWQRLARLIPAARPGGRPRSVDMREILNAICYHVRGGAAWRMLPHDLPPWGTVHYYYRRLRLDGTWLQINAVLRDQVRLAAGREAEPSAAIIDSQSVKTTEKGGSAAMTLAST